MKNERSGVLSSPCKDRIANLKIWGDFSIFFHFGLGTNSSHFLLLWFYWNHGQLRNWYPSIRRFKQNCKNWILGKFLKTVFSFSYRAWIVQNIAYSSPISWFPDKKSSVISYAVMNFLDGVYHNFFFGGGLPNFLFFWFLFREYLECTVGAPLPIFMKIMYTFLAF